VSRFASVRIIFSSLKLTFFISFPTQTALSKSARYLIISEQETDAILQSAADCADGECSVNDVTDLVTELQAQQKVLQTRLDKIVTVIADLEHVNEKDSRTTDEVRVLVNDMLRVFSREAPKFRATGYSGDVGKGPTDAYDSLSPKKWTPKKE
jgi:hypothetical protein